MRSLKILTFILFTLIASFACFRSAPDNFVISESKAYEASLFRQNCSICHGPNGEGSILETGTKVPSLREGVFKFNTENEIYNQIANGGNGMTAFREQLTERELRLMAEFVHDKLRKPRS